jgi:putative transposase
MFSSLRHFIGWIVSALGSRKDLILENLALRQQLLSLHNKRPRRRLSNAQAVLGCSAMALVGMESSSYSGQASNRGGVASGWFSPVLEMALPSQPGRWATASEQGSSGADLSPGCGEPDVGSTSDSRELLKLGFNLSEPTVSRWLRRAPRGPDVGKRWLTFLRNHREAIAAMDFFTVPTLTFGVLYCFFIIEHDRRKILRFNVTRNPNTIWIVQQIREAWPYVPAHRFFVRSRLKVRN